MLNLDVMEIKKDKYDEWDDLIDDSPQGTVFHKSSLLEAYSKSSGKEFKILGCYEGDKLIGGCSFFIHKFAGILKIASSVSEITPYGGIVLLPSRETEVRNQEQNNLESIRSITNALEDGKYNCVEFINSPDVKDIRPFIWDGWEGYIRYTYYLDLNNIQLSKYANKNIKNAIKKNINVEKSNDIESFYNLLCQTFDYKRLKVPIELRNIKELFDLILEKGLGQMWIAKNESGDLAAAEIFLYDTKRAYRWMAASHIALRKTGAVSLLLNTIFSEFQGRGFKEINLMAAGTPKLAEFLTSFNPKLVPFFIVKKKTSFFELSEIIYRIIK